MRGDRQPDAVIEEVAAAQHGVVTRAQLSARGLSRRAIDHQVAKRPLTMMYRGVYRVGPVVSPRAREMAAALACGPSAVVSHRSAAAVWQCVPPQRAVDPVDITVPGVVRHRIGGIQAHRSRRLASGEVVREQSVPATSAARTLLDLANILGAAELERAAAQAERLQLITACDVLTKVQAHPRHPGTRALRILFGGDAPPAFTRSEAESRLVELIRKARLRAADERRPPWLRGGFPVGSGEARTGGGRLRLPFLRQRVRP